MATQTSAIPGSVASSAPGFVPGPPPGLASGAAPSNPPVSAPTHPLVANAGASPGASPQPAQSTADGDGAMHLSASMARLPVSLAVLVPVRQFRVRSLLAMAPGAVIETNWGHSEDLPLASGEVQLAWSEFEVVDTRLAVRVTRLA